MAFGDWSTTAASNGTTLGVNIAENCPPSNVNDAIRKVMADLRTAVHPTLDTFLASTTLAQARTALGVSGGSTSANNFFGLTHTANKIPVMAAADAWTQADTNQFVPTGGIIDFASSTAPSGFLECNGAAVSRTTYSALFTVIGTTFGSGDGSTTFNLPDLRGEFVRGYDNGRGVDSGRVFGSSQAESVGPHSHDIELSGYTDISHDSSAEGDRTISSSGTPASGYISNNSGTENRPRNVALLKIIKT